MQLLTEFIFNQLYSSRLQFREVCNLKDLLGNSVILTEGNTGNTLPRRLAYYCLS